MNRAMVAGMAALAVTLTACAAIPTEGEVAEGNGEVLPVAPFEPILSGPAPEDGPAAIVTGFLTASAGGVATDFTVARQFLTDEAAAQWDPGAQTIVYSSGAVAPEWDEETHTVAYEVPLDSTLDDSGLRSDATEGDVVQLVFEMTEVDGQWRISELADGVVVTAANFQSFYRQVPLVFATSDLSMATSELRWLPDNFAATAAARELVQGPSAWLADAVETGFPATAALAVESVVVDGGVATVDLTAQSAGTLTERALADEQLRLTLSSLPDVTSVDVRIGGLPISDEVEIDLDPVPVPDRYAAVIVDNRLGLWNGEEVRITPGEIGLLPEGTRGVARNYDGSSTAFVTGEGVSVTRALAGGWDAAVPADAASDATDVVESTLVFAANDAVDPSFDRYGDLWVARQAGGGLQVVTTDGETITLGADWLSGRSINAVSVSPSGTYVAVQSRTGGQPILEVVAVVRDSAGVPLALGEPKPVGPGVGLGVDISWVDDLTFAVLGEPVEGSASPLWTVTVGGATAALATVRDAVSVSARSGVTSLVVASAEGTVEERSGTSWSQVLEGITDIAYAG